MRSSSFSSRRLALDGEVFISKEDDDGPLPKGFEVSDVERRFRENDNLDREDELRCRWSWFSANSESLEKKE